MKEKPEPAAALYRCSDPKQENSIDRQRLLVEPYAKRRNYELLAEYVFDGVPGDEISRHPEWKRFLKDAQEGKFKVVVCEDRKRLNRENHIDYFVEVAKPFRDCGLRLDTVKEGMVDPTTVVGGILTVVGSGEASGEVKTTSQRVLSTQAKLAKEGKAFAKKANYGLRKVYEVDPKTEKRKPVGWTRGTEPEAQAVELMYDRIGNKRWSLAAVAAELDKQGFPPPPNGRRKIKTDKPRWNRRTIHSIITNPIYKGDLLWNVRHRGKYHAWRNEGEGQLLAYELPNYRESVNRIEDQIHKSGEYDALVDPGLWARANAALPKAKKRIGSSGKRASYLLSGLLVCGDCSMEMKSATVRAGKGYQCSKYHSYGPEACYHNHVLEKLLLQVIRDQLLNVVLNPARLFAFEEECKRLLAAERTEDKLRELRRRIDELERAKETATRNLAFADPEDYADIKAIRDGIKTELQEKKDRLADLETDGGPQQRILAEARRQLNRFLEGLSSEDEEQQAVVISEVISKAVVYFRHDRTHGKRSKIGKGRTLSFPTRVKLYVRPGLGVSEVFTTEGRGLCSA
ncbi:MAG TPA: recombinase family protein [Gemmataceae bacterium]|nr:recombinase family protein [Gemmataceae bacterium]